MQESTMCNGKNDKPGKYDYLPAYKSSWTLNNMFSDVDKKRTTICKNPIIKAKK